MNEATDDAIRHELKDVFDLPNDLISVLIAMYPVTQDWCDVLEWMCREIAKLEGYPCTVNDQQPFDIAHTFPLALSPDAYDTKEDHDLVMRLFWLWGFSIAYRCEGKSIDEINHYIRVMNVRIVRAATPSGKEDARRWVESTNWLNTLRLQHGLLDLESGQLIDRTEYTLRQTIAEINGLQDSGVLATGDMLDTDNLRALIFEGGSA
jgi:hypothetical protein